MNLFVYGTLMNRDIMLKISGKEYSCMPGTLYGYSRKRIRFKKYPAIISDNRSSVNGLLYSGLDDESMRRIDKYEGSMYYRENVKVQCGHDLLVEAQVYIIAKEAEKYVEDREWIPVHEESDLFTV